MLSLAQAAGTHGPNAGSPGAARLAPELFAAWTILELDPVSRDMSVENL